MSPNTAAPIATVIDLYVQATGELFSAYGLIPGGKDAGARKAHEMRYVSILSATGQKIRLLSTLNIDESLLACMHPSRERDLSQRQLEDWCRELNNQLMGRMKNKLLRVGCEVMTGLPSLITGTDVSAVSSPDLDFREYFFASAQGRLESTLAMLLAPDLGLADAPEAEEVMREGVLSLFERKPAAHKAAR
jgi:hypothetical protein